METGTTAETTEDLTQEPFDLISVFDPVARDIQEINQNIDALVELQKEQNAQAEAEQTAEPVEATAETETMSVQSVEPVEVTEPVEEVPEEEQPNPELEALTAILTELQETGETLQTVSETQIAMQEQQELARQADHIINSYGLIVVPIAIVIYAISKLVNPFVR